MDECAPLPNVVRWRRYGHDRLYVNAADGVRLGYRDLRTGEDRIEVAARVAEFHAVMAAWLANAEGVMPVAGTTSTENAESSSGSVPTAPARNSAELAGEGPVGAPLPAGAVNAVSATSGAQIVVEEGSVGHGPATAAEQPASAAEQPAATAEPPIGEGTGTGSPGGFVPRTQPLPPGAPRGSGSRSSLGRNDMSGEDLAQRSAGSMAREQASSLRKAAPVRTFLARMVGLHTEERAWRIGAVGEEKVAAQLAKCARKDPRWTFLHAIPVGERGSDIDHVVIGPGGVFTLNAKHHPGAKIWIGGDTLMINGQRQPYIRNSRYEAERAGRLLSAGCGFHVPVLGMVVPVGVDEIVVKTPPRDVRVVPREALVAWLRSRP